MKATEKLDILIELYINGELDKEDYIRIRKEIEQAIEREKEEKKN